MSRFLFIILLPVMLFILFFYMSADAQDQGGLNPTKFTVIPPGPNAAGISKYGNIPVNLFNGLPNIDVPLGKIAIGDEYASEIGISYHAGGNRVDDIASFTGLGWSLRAGGVITRTLRGMPDEVGYVGQSQQRMIPAGSPLAPTASTFDQFDFCAKGMIDTQPDEFSYNMGGYSGKFVVDSNKQIYLLPYKDIKVTWMEDINGIYFTIVTEDGTKYIFNNKETTQTNDCSGNADFYVSSWYLSQIILPKSKRSIGFEYITDPGLSIAATSQTESRTVDNDQALNDIVGCPVNVPQLSNCNSSRVQRQNKIKKITFPGGRITFNYNFKRTDLAPDSFYALSEIVYAAEANGSYTDLNKFLFNYTTPDRLKLQSVNTADANNNVTYGYAFVYDNTLLPAVNSYSKDHWGYYNGASNSSLIPAEPGLAGANREPNLQYTQAGVLKQIVYPTEGTTSFEFESNTYSRYGTASVVADPVYGNGIAYKSIRTGVSGSTTYPDEILDSLSITLNIDQFVSINMTLSSCCANLATCYIRNSTTGEIFTPANGSNYLYLVAGTYNVVLHATHAEPTVSYEQVTADIQYKTVTAYTGVAVGGGLRLKRMVTYDGIDHAKDNIKNYTYKYANDTSASTGYLTNRPKYEYTYTRMCTRKNGNAGELPCRLIMRTSAANNEIEASGGSVIYKEVLETDNQNGSHRYVYEFSDNASGLGIYPFGPSTDTDPAKGMLIAEYTYSNSGQLLSKSLNTYTTYLKGSIRGWKTGYKKKGANTVGYPNEDFVTNYYTYRSQGALLTNSTKTDYSGTDSLVTETITVYDNMNHILPTRIHQQTSEGYDLWTYRKYPTDFATPAGTLSTGAQALKQMQDSNIHNVPIEQYQQLTKQGVISTIAGQYVRYKILPATTSSMVVMDTAFRLKVAAPLSNFTSASVQSGVLKTDTGYEADIVFASYDSTGNIKEQRDVNGVNEVYLWGYNNLYPVAKVVGTSYDTAISYVNKNILRTLTSDSQLRDELNKIRTGLSGSNVLVSTFTYLPQVGVTSETDPTGKTTYYEYDAFGRLKVIRDMIGKILKQFSYQYVQPITQ